MTARTTRSRRALGAVALTTGALAVSLLPAATAQADPTGAPVFSYVDTYVDITNGVPPTAVRQLAVDDVLGSNATPSTTPVGTDPTNLTGSDVQTYTYDASQDGSTLVVAARTGSPTSLRYDSTYGLVAVHNDGTTTTSTLLTNFWTGNPVVTDGGNRVWWLNGGGDSGLPVVLYSRDLVAGVSTAQSTAFAPTASETVDRLAVSADGTMAAVLYDGTATPRTDRVLAAPVATGTSTPNYAQVSFPTLATPDTTPRPDSASFVWRGDSQLLLSTHLDSAPKDLKGASIDLDGTTTITAVTAQPALDGFYDLRPMGTTWWMWKDDSSTPAKATAYSQTDADLLTVPVVNQPVPQLPDRGNGFSTFRYTPSTVAPPALVAASNRAASRPNLAFTASTVRYGTKVSYLTQNFYCGGVGAACTTSAEMDRGDLLRSYDGVHYAKIATTTCNASCVAGTSYYNGTVTATRNSWYRWTYPGDAFVTGFTSITRKINVSPIVHVSVTKYANGTRRIAGWVTRNYGYAQLWRYYSGAWHKLSTIPIAWNGAFNFGTKLRPRGTYRVVTVPDGYWISGSAQFSF